MKGKVVLGIALIVMLSLAGCAKKADMAGSQSLNKSSTANEMKVSNSGTGGVAADSKADSEAAKSNGSTVEVKKVIQHCNLYIVADDLKKLSSELHSKSEQLGGYIENEDLMEERSTAKIRIPAVKFDEFISFAEKSYDVKNKNITTENVTDAYVDNEARIKNLRAQEEQVLSILKKANTVEEVLKVQSELYRIRGEAEALEAKKKNWDKEVDYATITISSDRKNIVVDNKKSIIGGKDFVKASSKGFNNTLISLVLFIEKFFIFVISNIIPIAILAILGFFGYKGYRKYNKNK